MRSLLLLWATAALVACGSGESTDDTDEDTNGSSGCADNPDAPVPEDLRCLWELQYNGCTTSNGSEGRQVYWRAEGSVDAEGNITGTEKIWWFYPDAWAATDCVDSLDLTGTRLFTDLGLLQCESCEEGYQTRRAVSVDNCSNGYNNLFREDDDGYFQTVLLDTQTTDGNPNEDNKILVLHRTLDRNGNEKTEEYARGNMTPQGAAHEPPYTFTWTGSTCKGR